MALEVTVDGLRRLLWARGVPTVATDEELLEASRAPEHKLGMTVLSAFAAAGRTLTPEQETELNHYRDRIERYREAWKEIHAVAPGAYRNKGDEIAQFYPEGVLRPSSDLDVVIRDPAQLWAAAHRLVELDWTIGAMTIVASRDGGEDILVECQKYGDEDIFGIYYGVELRTVDIPTSVRQPAFRVPDPYGSPLAVNTIALLAERWEREFTSRDRLDMALLVDRLTEADQTALVAALDATKMWPEWREITREIGRLSWLPNLPILRAAEQQRRNPTRVQRIAHGVRLWGHPVRALAFLAQSTVDTDRGRLADSVAAFVGRHVGSQRVLRLGVPLFGVPLPDPPGARPDKLSLVRRGRHLVAESPVGEFLLVTSSCQEDWIEEARAR